MSVVERTAAKAIQTERGFSARSNGGDGFEIVDRHGVTWAWVRGGEIGRIVIAALLLVSPDLTPPVDLDAIIRKTGDESPNKRY